MKVAIIGAGSWGTALAIKSCAAKNDTIMYHRDPEKAKFMNSHHTNPDYLINIDLPAELQIDYSLERVLSGAQIVLFVTPSQYAREALEQCAPFITDNMYLVSCSKGLERQTGLRMTQVIQDVVGHKTEHIGVLSGPNHAEEVAINKPAMTVIGTIHDEDGLYIQQALHSPTFRVYTNKDIIGIELGSTTKNIIALAAGIAHGMEMGDNAIAALLTRGLHEMTKFGMAFGAKRETYSGLTGMGDLIATALSGNSRNRRAGLALAKGATMETICKETNMVVEGFNAVFAVAAEAEKNNIDMPITFALKALLEGKMTPKEAVSSLMDRQLKNEMEVTL